MCPQPNHTLSRPLRYNTHHPNIHSPACTADSSGRAAGKLTDVEASTVSALARILADG